MKKQQITHIKDIAPTGTDNIASGYNVGQWWEDTTTGKKYFHKTDGVWIDLENTIETLIFNNPISTTSTSPVLVRSVNIGALNQYKKIVVDAETVSSNNNVQQRVNVLLRNVVDNVEMGLISLFTLGGNITIFKSFYINDSNIIVETESADNYSSNVTLIPPYINNFTPNEDYVVEVYINASSTETITNRGLTIQLYK